MTKNAILKQSLKDVFSDSHELRDNLKRIEQIVETRERYWLSESAFQIEALYSSVCDLEKQVRKHERTIQKLRAAK